MNNKHISFPKESKGTGIPDLVNFTAVDLKEEINKTIITLKRKILLFTLIINVFVQEMQLKSNKNSAGTNLNQNYFQYSRIKVQRY